MRIKSPNKDRKMRIKKDVLSMNSNDQIMDILDQLRHEQDLSYSEIARRVGMAKSAIHRYFKRQREFPLNKTAEFAKAFGVSPEYLLGFTKNGEFQRIYSELNEENRGKAYEFVKKLYERQKNNLRN